MYEKCSHNSGRNSKTPLTMDMNTPFTSKYEQAYVKSYSPTLLIPCKLVY